MAFLRVATFFLGAACLLGVAPGCRRAPAPPQPRSSPADPHGAAPEPALVGGETKAERGKHLALLYSSNLEGEYEHCGCPSHPLGGLVRRATVIDQARAEAGGVLVVDAGDLLLPAKFHAEDLSPPDPSEVSRRARLLLSAFARMGLAAFLPAERDLALGPQKLKHLLKSLRIPAVASNLLGVDGRPLFARDRIVEVAGIPVGIFGVVAPQPEDRALWKAWKLRVTPPEAAAREEIALLRARGAQMVVALLHLGGPGVASKFLEAVPGVDWAVEGHAGLQLQPPGVVGGARLVDALATGKFAGRLDIHLVGPGPVHPGDWQDRGERAELLTIIADHRSQLADLRRRAAEDRSGQLQDFYRQRREAITRALDDELARATKLPAAMKGSWYEGRMLPLDESIPDQLGIAMLVAAYNAESAHRASAGLPVGIALRSAEAARAATDAARPEDAGQQKPTRYAGSAACAGCHEPAARFFATTKHAHASSALGSVKGERRDRDPTCVGCHTTGFMLPGGTWSVDVATTRLRDVGCEACHGPSLGHISLADKKTTTHRQVPETVCRGCHTPDQTNGEFDYRSFLRAIVGPGHGA